MAGISSKALAFGEPGNKYKYNAKEQQSGEFSNGSGLQWMDFGARMYDSQIGRWRTLDLLSESMTRFPPYNFSFCNPLNYVDPDGMKPVWNGAGYFDDEKGNEYSLQDVQKYYQFGDYAANKNYIVVNMGTNESADLISMAMNNSNWTILNAINGDLAAAVKISGDKLMGASIDNVVMVHHGNRNYFGIASYANGTGGFYHAILTADKVDAYANGRTVGGEYSDVLETYLYYSSVIAKSLSKGGNFIFTA